MFVFNSRGMGYLVAQCLTVSIKEVHIGTGETLCLCLILEEYGI